MGSKLSPTKRAKLPKSDFACPAKAPEAGSYPINDPSHVASAKSYYRRSYTAKCKGGKTRICKRAKKFGMLKKDYPDSADWKKWCRGVI